MYVEKFPSKTNSIQHNLSKSFLQGTAVQSMPKVQWKKIISVSHTSFTKPYRVEWRMLFLQGRRPIAKHKITILCGQILISVIYHNNIKFTLEQSIKAQMEVDI